MHLLLPVRLNQPPLIAGHWHGRWLHTTMLVDLLALLNQLAIAKTIVGPGLLAISMAASLRSHVGRRLWDLSLLGQRMWDPSVGVKTGGSWVGGPKLCI